MRTIFMGTGEIGVPSLEWLIGNAEVVAVVTQPDKPVGRKQEMQAPATKLVAQKHGLPVLQPVKLRAPEAVAEIVALQPDLIVVMAYGQILSQAVLDAPKVACINLHASLLPRWRGAAPIQAAIEAGDSVTGVTSMYMAAGLDTGDILLMKETPISDTDTGGVLHDRLALVAVEALAESYALLEEGRAPRVPQDEALANYAAKLGRENGLIDWQQAPVQIDRRIRAMNPWPASFTYLPTPAGPRSLKVLAASIQSETGNPGEVLRADGDGLLVGASGGSVRLEEIQLEGKKRMKASEFLRGTPVAVGTVLGK